MTRRVRGGAASIKINDPNPDIEFVETDETPPAGRFEIAVASDKLQINGRNGSNSGFEPIVVFTRVAAGGNVGVRTASQFGAGKGVIAIANAVVAPSVNPAGGGILYVEDGALKSRHKWSRDDDRTGLTLYFRLSFCTRQFMSSATSRCWHRGSRWR